MSRSVRGLLALLVSAVALVLLAPATAGATVSRGADEVRALSIPGPSDFDCKEAPTPEVPGRGLTGFFETEPKRPPAYQNPFAPNARTTIYEQYGYAGLRWTTYDLGCGPDSARSPDAVAGTALANWLYLLPKVGVAFTNAVVEVAFRPTFLGVFDPLVRNVSDALYRTVFTDWVPVVLLATGLLLIWRARRADLASTTAAVGWAVLVFVIATALFRWPVEAGHVADASITNTLAAVNGGLNQELRETQTSTEKLAAANTHETLLYNAWLAGTFGKANSETAKRFGPELFDATALTWEEADQIRDPAERERIFKEKQEKYKGVAADVQRTDPDAYEYLTGKRSETRVGYAMLALFGALCVLPFLLITVLIVLGAFLIFRFAVMLFPAFAVLGLFPSMRSVVTTIGSTVVAALVNAILFGIAASVTLRGIRLLLDPDSTLPQWLSLTLMLLFSAVMWLITRPVRRFSAMVHSRRVGLEQESAASASGPIHRSGRGRHARRNYRQSRRERDEELQPTDSSVRSETHTITEAKPSVGLPEPFRFEPPMPAPTVPPRTGGSRAPTAVAAGLAGMVAGRAGARSANGSSPPPHESPSIDDIARETRDAPSKRTSGRVEAAREASPVAAGAPITAPHRSVGGDGASSPLTRPATTEEGGGPLYIPDRMRTPNGNGASGDTARVSVDEFAGPVYRPKGSGRAPSRTGE
jgi:hypothetical protein